MSVDNVQNKFLTMAEFNKLSEAEQARYNSASKSERKQLTIEFRQANAPQTEQSGVGTSVEPGKEETVTPEEKQTRAEKKAAAKAAKEAEIARQKEYAQSLFKPEELTEYEQKLIDTIIGENDDPFYKNKEAQNKLRDAIRDNIMAAIKKSPAYLNEINKARAEVEAAMKTGNQTKIEEAQSKIKSIQDFYEKMAENGAKIRIKDMAIGDKIEHTRVFDSQEEKSEARRQLGAEADDLRLKVHKDKILADENVNLHKAIKQDGVSSHEAAYNIAKDISGDRTFEPNEAMNFAAKSSDTKSHDAAARRELRRLGFDVKDDTMKNLGKALAVGVLSQAGTAALPVAVSAFAEAIVQNSVTGEVLAYDSASKDATIFNWKGMGIGAAVGTALAGALFGKTQDEDVLHGVGIQEVFADAPNGKRTYENMSFGSKEDTLKVKTLLRAIDEMKLSDEQKTQFLIEAAGENGQRILSKKELAIAYVKAFENQLPDKIEAPKPPKEPETITITPEIEIENTEKEKVKQETVPRFGYKRKSGEYWYGIAQNMYVTEDGKPIGGKAANDIAQMLKKAYNIDRNSAYMPEIVELDYVVEINGKKYKLIDTSDPDKFVRSISDKMPDKAKTGISDNIRATETRDVPYTDFGYKASVDDKLVEERDGFTTRQARDEAAAKTREDLEEKYPPYEVIKEE